MELGSLSTWLLLIARWTAALVAVAVILYRAWPRIRWLWLGREVAIATSAYFLYFLVRGLTEADKARAVTNAHRVIDLERVLGLYREEWLQSLILDTQLLITLSNWVYIWGHWPFIGIVAGWLLLNHPAIYTSTRNAFLVSGGVGLIVFALFPVAPPRLLDLGFVDTVTDQSSAYRVLQPPAFVNQYAAVPSLHFGWNLLIGIAIVRAARSPWVRAIGFVPPIFMFFAVIVTANHFVIDPILGAALCLVALATIEWRRSCRAWLSRGAARLRSLHRRRGGEGVTDPRESHEYN